MSATERSFVVAPPSAPPSAPDRDVPHVDPSDVHELSTDFGQTEAPGRLGGADQVREEPIVAELDEDGLFMLRDLLGAVYGTGETVSEAREDFFASLDDHLAYLRAHKHELHPRLARQLEQLQELFPGR